MKWRGVGHRLLLERCGRAEGVEVLIKLSQIPLLHTPLVGLHTEAKVDFLSKIIWGKNESLTLKLFMMSIL